MIVSPRKPLEWVVVFSLLVAATVLVPVTAEASSNCGTSSGHNLCLSAADTLTGEQTVTVTNSPNNGVVFATWVPSGGKALQLIEIDAPSPATTDYSFVWPTQKYLDGSGTLSLQAGSIGSAAVMIAVTLSNGNTTDFQHSPKDWMNSLPGSWTGPEDPTILAVGDGPSNEVTSNAVASRIAALDPPLFLFLGDVYETGTFTEFRNHYGASELDTPGAGTLWGETADITQPTLGNHEKPNSAAFIDYWHGRPLFTSFTFGGTLFLDMNSSASMSATSAQYQFVKSAVTNPSAPNCIVAFWHIPAVVTNTSVTAGQTAMWALLANNGVDLLVTGHQHKMVEFNPLDADLNPTPQAHLVQLVSGAGGHKLAGPTSVGARVAWSKGGTAGLLSLSLAGAAGGNAATSIGWQFQTVSGSDLHDGSVDCGSVANHAPVVNSELPHDVRVLRHRRDVRPAAHRRRQRAPVLGRRHGDGVTGRGGHAHGAHRREFGRRRRVIRRRIGRAGEPSPQDREPRRCEPDRGATVRRIVDPAGRDHPECLHPVPVQGADHRGCVALDRGAGSGQPKYVREDHEQHLLPCSNVGRRRVGPGAVGNGRSTGSRSTDAGSHQRHARDRQPRRMGPRRSHGLHHHRHGSPHGGSLRRPVRARPSRDVRVGPRTGIASFRRCRLALAWLSC
ncbi:MAG: hypothetical protein E6G37_09010 [Actinobacteria bacterium]|nr:MAG: hypothetical protein E6G37_09010 [Actinomycetota bacterium]